MGRVLFRPGWIHVLTQYPIQASFSKGELSPRLHARVDIAHYKAGLQVCENFIVLRQGGLRRRAGTRFAARMKSTSGNCRLMPFVFSSSQSYVLELGDHYMRFFTPSGQVILGGNPYEIVTPWAATDVMDLQFAQQGDQIRITHASYPPQILSRFSETNWTIVPIDFQDGPYIDIVKDGSTLTPNGTGNIVPVMTSNTAPSGTVVDSAATTTAWQAFDGVNTTDWDGAVGTSWLRYQFPSAKVVEGYSILASANVRNVTVGSSTVQVPGSLRTPRTWTFEGSNDAVAWTVLDSRAAETGWGDGERRFYSFINVQAFLYYRIFVTDVNKSQTAPTGVSIAELALAGGGTDRATVRLTASAITAVNGGAGFSSSDVGRHVRFLSESAYWHWLKITNVVSTSVVDATLRSPPLPSIKGTSTWRLGAFSTITGWPARVALYQERLFYARTNTQPQSLWGSKTASFEDFGVSVPLNPADSVTLTLNELGEIQWLADGGDLLIATINSVRPVGPADKSQGFSATNFQQGKKTRTGANSVPPVSAGSANIFVDHYGTSLHEMAYSYDEQGYVAPDVSVLSEHLFQNGAHSLSYALKPNAIAWSGANDGSLIGMTYEREQQMVALHHHSLAANGVILSQCVIPGPTYDQLWLAVSRGTLRTIEYMAPDFEGKTMDQSAAYYVDCGLSYSGTAVKTVSGLSHLEGMTVAIFADGAPEVPAVVSGGSVTLPSGQLSSVIHVGLPYTSMATTLAIPTGGQDGSGLGRKKRVKKVILNLMETGAIRVQATGKSEEVILRSTNDPMSEAVPLFTGNRDARVDDQWSNGGVLTMIVDQPVPATIRAITPAYESEP